MQTQGEIRFTDDELKELETGGLAGQSAAMAIATEASRRGMPTNISATTRLTATDLIVEAAFEQASGLVPAPVELRAERTLPSIVGLTDTLEMPSPGPVTLTELPAPASPWDGDEDRVEAANLDDEPAISVVAKPRDSLLPEEELPAAPTVISPPPQAPPQLAAAGPAAAIALAPRAAIADEAMVLSSSPPPDASGPKVSVADQAAGRLSSVDGDRDLAPSHLLSESPRSGPHDREPEIEADEEDLGGHELDLEDLQAAPVVAPSIGPPPTPPVTALDETRRVPAPTPPAIPLPRPIAASPPPSPAAAASSARPAVAPPPVPAASTNGADASQDKSRRKRRAKQWFEEIFDEDYLSTLPFMTPRQTERESSFIVDALHVAPSSALLDIGCGYGRHAMELAGRGHKVTGLDLSLPLLIRAADAARRAGVNVNFIHGDMREMGFNEEFDAAYSFFSTFGYFDDDTNRAVAAQIGRALKPGGRLLLDLINRDYLIGDLPTRVWWQGEGCVVLEEVDFNYFTSRLQVHRSIVFEDGRQSEQDISIRAYSLHEIGKVLHHAGFRVTEVSGGLALRGRFFGAEARQMLVVAEKKDSSAT